MHKMHANRVSIGGTSAALDDGAIKRISNSMNKEHYAEKQTAPVKKTAGKEPSKESKEIIKIANLHNIPSDFERIGTGFYRRGHHLWELAPSSDGFMLVRKRGEDHVLGFDPEPTTRNTDVTDRHGNTVKVGAKVKLPHRGKVADAVVIVVRPETLGVELEDGERIDTPPDMCELIDEVAPGSEFEPSVEPSSKAEERIAKKTAQMNIEPMTSTTPSAPSTPPKPEIPRREESRLLSILDKEGFGIFRSNKLGGKFVGEKRGNQYAIYHVQEKLTPFAELNTPEKIMNWERQVGDLEYMRQDVAKLGHMIKAALKSTYPDLQTWRDYWCQIGQKFAQRKQLTPEQKERRRQRRKERKQEMKGLPPGTVLPPKKPPRMGAVGLDDAVASLKEKVRLYQQLIDEIEYILQDETLRTDEVRLADELDRALTEHYEQLEESEDQADVQVEDELSIETPPQDDKVEPQIKTSKVIVSMLEL